MTWVQACAVEAIDEEDVTRFDYGEKTFAIYRSSEDRF
jgi:3-phenylpropionate/trans-cinnamate dioxygenase ferredoxin component